MIREMLPQNLKNDYRTYNYLFGLFCYNEDLVLDYSEVKFVEGNICVILELLKENSEHEIIEENIPYNIMGLFKRNKYINSVKTDNRNTTIEIKKHFIDEAEEFALYIDERVLGHTRMNDIAEVHTELISSVYNEIFANVEQHTESEIVISGGQFYLNRKKMTFVIGNLTKTFKEVVGVKDRKEFTEIECVKWALKQGNSTKKDSNLLGGSGLSILEHIISSNNGVFIIASGKAFYYADYQNGGEKIVEKELCHSFPGSIVIITVDLTENLVLSDEEMYKTL